MKTIGLIGGMSWQSTALYYSQINQGVADSLGQLNSAKICLVSVNFAEIEKLQHAGNWPATAEILSDAARRLQLAGADFILICTNTMHRVYDEIQAVVSIPILHIAEPTAQALIDDGISRVGLLGTAFTMEQDFYKRKLIDDYNLDVIVPEFEDRKFIHDVIYHELCKGNIREASRNGYIAVMNKMASAGAEAFILGCTEITLLITPPDSSLPLYDTTELHARKAVQLALN